ncbi:MAG: 2 3-bisphosphoglycerate-independent phosphoglycerate mutase [Puniceicoccaceae bacterium 5H]|nr:MAG: 2 3-bisphosphoglycerate-independent phosphoglycerate mutase [Puniceicoccaceae bacterium 5H]
MSRQPVVLIIRDGWGENHNSAHDSYNAVKLANTPVADKLTANWPRTEIMACGRDVGLPKGVMGNSEVGHQNIGAGRIVDQEITRIDKAFEEGTVSDNAVLNAAVDHTKNSGGALHLMGLVSDAGVHAMLDHLYGLLQFAKDKGVEKLYVHCFTDGRDTGPFSGKGYIEQLEKKMLEIGIGQIASVSGRFWAMDRDQRWDRVEKAYNCLTARKIERKAGSASDAVQAYYDKPLDDNRKGDEFVVPTAIVNNQDEPVGPISNGDAVVFFNFRGDRPRELTRAFIQSDFDGFDRGDQLDIYYATMTEYQKDLCDHVVFRKPAKMPSILGSYVSELGIQQFRCAETEKFPHVTFFFNDYREEPFEGEDRELIQSPKDVSTYDQKPEMSAYQVKDATKKAILSGKYGLIVVNFANADMVGHTGVIDAAVKACETVDACVGELLEALDEVGGKAVITADHGNSDQLRMEDGSGAHTSHTLNPVEVVVYGKGCEQMKLKDGGRLADIAPTMLKLMDLPQPEPMTGDCLIQG